MIPASTFVEGFAAVWHEAVAREPRMREWPFRGDKAKDKSGWKKRIEAKDGLLGLVSNHLHTDARPLQFHCQYRFRLDCALTGRTMLLRVNGREYHSELYAIVEHEMGWNPEEEMWKLSHIQSPLKVLIFYDVSEECKTTPRLQNWLALEMDELRMIGQSVHGFWPETSGTEYAFIVGRQNARDDSLTWWFTTRPDLPLTDLEESR